MVFLVCCMFSGMFIGCIVYVCFVYLVYLVCCSVFGLLYVWFYVWFLFDWCFWFELCDGVLLYVCYVWCSVWVCFVGVVLLCILCIVCILCVVWWVVDFMYVVCVGMLYIVWCMV